MGFGTLQNAVAAFILVAKPIPPCNASYPPLADPTCPFKSPPIAMYSSGNLRFGGGHLSSSRKHPSRCQGSPSAGRGLRQLKESPCLISSWWPRVDRKFNGLHWHCPTASHWLRAQRHFNSLSNWFLKSMQCQCGSSLKLRPLPVIIPTFNTAIRIWTLVFSPLCPSAGNPRTFLTLFGSRTTRIAYGGHVQIQILTRPSLWSNRKVIQPMRHSTYHLGTSTLVNFSQVIFQRAPRWCGDRLLLLVISILL